MLKETIIVMHGKYKICVDYVSPPIPTNALDYCATWDHLDEDSPQGWGATPEEAVENLMDFSDDVVDIRENFA